MIIKVYVMFLLLDRPNGGAAAEKYEFKDRIQCEQVVINYKKMSTRSNVFVDGYCQEVIK